MKKDNLIRLLSVSVCIVLIAAMVLFVNGCGKQASGKKESPSSSSFEDAKTVGSGSESFKFAVVDDKGNEKHFIVKTDKDSVGEALQDAKLITGEMGDYGLMVKSVDGVKLDYDEDGRYWAFYVDDGYAVASADQTKIEKGKIYSFRNEKA